MKEQQQWSSKMGFILAAAGSAIGLGAIWKFPYITGTNGGGIFLFIFILFTLILGAPMLLGEFIIGRSTQKDAIGAFKHFGKSKYWQYIGKFGFGASFLLLSYYTVIGGWVVLYLLKTVTGGLSGLTNAQYGEIFNRIIENPTAVLTAQFLFIAISVLVVKRGIQSGIEKASKIMMPALFILFIVLAIRAITLDGAMEGIKFLFKPDFNAVTWETVVLAMGQAFFTLTLGITAMITYSSYLPKNENLTKSVGSVVTMNILICILAGLVIFPSVFALGFDPAQGPGLIFVVLPAVFNQMPLGTVFLALFLILLLFATLTSTFSILEIIVAGWIKNDQKKRGKTAWTAGIIIFLLGIPSALSFGLLKDWHILNMTFFDFADFLVSNIAMPLGAFFSALFLVYVIPKKVLKHEISVGVKSAENLFKVWYFTLKFVAPVLIIIVTIKTLIDVI